MCLSDEKDKASAFLLDQRSRAQFGTSDTRGLLPLTDRMRATLLYASEISMILPCGGLHMLLLLDVGIVKALLV